jgi:hypothetical protein
MSDIVKANILHHSAPVVSDVEVSFIHGHGGVPGAASWGGSFTLPVDGFIALGGPFDLLLHDGRQAQILIRDMQPTENGHIIVEFTGVGHFPRKVAKQTGRFVVNRGK